MPSAPRALIALALLSLLTPLTTAAGDAGRPLAFVPIAMTDAAAPTIATLSYVPTSLDALDVGPVAPASPPSPVETAPAALVATIAMPVAAPVAVPAGSPIAAPAAPPIAKPAAAPASCPSDWLCYPRLGIAGPILPYADCAGKTDVGGSIREFTCLGSLYLMGHAYTKFGGIAAWPAGDVVTAHGQTFTITSAVTARSCEPPPLPLAALSLQTSLTPNACGAVLIVQGR